MYCEGRILINTEHFSEADNLLRQLVRTWLMCYVPRHEYTIYALRALAVAMTGHASLIDSGELLRIVVEVGNANEIVSSCANIAANNLFGRLRMSQGCY